MKKILIGIALLVVVMGLGLVYKGMKTEMEIQAFSCASAIAARLQEAPPSVFGGNRLSARWTALTDDEYDPLMRRLHPYDCGGMKWGLAKRSDVPTDAWGKRFRVAVRQSANGTIESIVWSKGADGGSRTADDIVIPYGETVPMGLE